MNQGCDMSHVTVKCSPMRLRPSQGHKQELLLLESPSSSSWKFKHNIMWLAFNLSTCYLLIADCLYNSTNLPLLCDEQVWWATANRDPYIVLSPLDLFLCQPMKRHLHGSNHGNDWYCLLYICYKLLSGFCNQCIHFQHILFSRARG